MAFPFYGGFLQAGQSVNPLEVLALMIGIIVIGALGMGYKLALVGSVTADDGGAPADADTNCPHCGARISSDVERCEYCGEPAVERLRGADG